MCYPKLETSGSHRWLCTEIIRTFWKYWWPGVPHLETLAGPHTALHTAVLRWEDTRTCPNQCQCGSLSNEDTSCSLKATHASRMKFHEHMLEPPRGNPNEIPALSLLPSIQCCKVRLITNVHRARGMEKVTNRVMLLIFTSANSKFHICHISQDGCYRSECQREEHLPVGARGRRIALLS